MKNRHQRPKIKFLVCGNHKNEFKIIQNILFNGNTETLISLMIQYV